MISHITKSILIARHCLHNRFNVDNNPIPDPNTWSSGKSFEHRPEFSLALYCLLHRRPHPHQRQVHAHRPDGWRCIQILRPIVHRNNSGESCYFRMVMFQPTSRYLWQWRSDETTKWTQWREELVAQRLEKGRAVTKWPGGEDRATHLAQMCGLRLGFPLVCLVIAFHDRSHGAYCVHLTIFGCPRGVHW